MMFVDTCKDFPVFDDIKSSEKISVTLKVSYKNNINIYQIHNYIKRNFAICKSKVDGFRKIAEIHLEKSKSDELTHNQKMKLIKKSRECELMGKKCDSEEDWNFYIEESIPLLQEYAQLSEKISKRRINLQQKEYNVLIEERICVIERYFTVVSNFLKVDISRNYEEIYKCPVCDKEFDESLIALEYSHYNCECGHSFYLISRDIAYHNHNQVSPLLSFEENNDNFTETIDRFCGRYAKVSIPSELYKQFDEYLIKNKNLTGEQIKKLPFEKSKHKEKIGNLRGTSVSMLISMLKKTNNSLYYDNINIIGHNYFGWTLPDLSEWTGDIMKIYDLTKKVYNRMVNKRLSVLNGNVILFFILNYLQIPCSRSDFKLMDTKDSFDDYKANWEIMSNDKDVIDARNKIFKNRGIKPKEKMVMSL